MSKHADYIEELGNVTRRLRSLADDLQRLPTAWDDDGNMLHSDHARTVMYLTLMAMPHLGLERLLYLAEKADHEE